MKIIVKKYIPELVLRKRADAFFDYLESLPETEIELNFIDLDSISRSFAHQYKLRLNQSPKKIKELNVSNNLKLMFNIVESSKERSYRFDFSKAKEILV
jgi:hypothetical protein